MDAMKFSPKKKSTFLRAADLAVSGPRVLTIGEVVSGEGFPDREKGVRPKELQLLFTEGVKVGLGSGQIFDQAIALLGRDTTTWPGRDVEAYCDMTVQSPQGRGGVRLRAVSGALSLEDGPSESELAEPPVKGNGAEKPKPKRSAGSARPKAAVPSPDDDDDAIPF